MTSLTNVLAGVTDADARAALYYVGRYVKQARNFRTHNKDVFDDVRRSAPSALVKSLAQGLIAAIEEREGVHAEEFAFDHMLTILREIAALERELGPDVSDEEAKRAARFFIEFDLPSPKI
ncbi:hypothetical protein [Agrobacterium rosae]|uniref:Uncharacterized protein n=1 Tax=Agrobacterium rosae TaxID=1972867 RepID=A0A1R3U3U1_9HYPH|nr:hypothetical protein [Agrobacterium rosae]SCX31571.1 hypothetical protein DSM25559_3748 [Agrobacterium rosae]